MRDHNYCQILVGMVENNKGYAKRLEHTLQQSPDIAVLRIWHDVETALKEIPQQLPDIMVMDIQWPDDNGIAYIRKMKAACPGVQFLVYTRCADDENVFEAFKAGASGYLLKGERQEILVKAIREMQAGGSPMSLPISRKVIGAFSQKPVANRGVEVLTKREMEVLALLSEGKMYKEVSIMLGIEMETTKKHIRNIYGKLQVQNRTEAVNKWQLPWYLTV
jgi:NarL family two-component system response regulator LiaR